MAYAIIEMGGKQYRVEKGDSVLVDRVSEDEGAKLSPRALLYSGDGQAVFEGAGLDKVKIEAVVAEHLKGEKIRVFKYRPKKRYRKTQGHRSLLSRLEIREIHGPAARKRAAGSTEGSKAAAGSAQGPKRPAGSGTGRSKAKEEEGE
jgi:large subunit ribosomal protein L21